MTARYRYATPTVLPDSLPPVVRGDAPRTAGVSVQPPADELSASGFDLEAHVKEIERKNLIWGWTLFAIFLVLLAGTIIVAVVYLAVD